MCGIAGVMWTDRARSGEAVAAAARMQRALAHRGPDDRGLWSSPLDAGVGVAFGHTRLSVIDLSEGAAQPMRRGRHVIAYNGEIYNYRELRARLEDRGCRFSTASDTEVLLRAWETWGADSLLRLRGMFAFGLWDEAEGRLTLARDRFGIKPLYVAETRGMVVFGSEVRSVLASDLLPRRLNVASLDHYLGFQTAPTPDTLVAGVDMLPPASMATAGERGMGPRRAYWHPLAATSAPASHDARHARVEVGRLLEDTARAHLVSDVPVGIFLSGGIDSTALLSAVRSLGVTPRTFSVTFAEAAYDESAFAREAAGLFGADHTELRLTEDELVESLPEVLSSIDHPSGDGVNTFVVSRAVRACGIKVAWSGLGGDELFGGYPSFRRLARALPFFSRWAKLPRSVRETAADLLRRGAPASVAAGKIGDAAAGDGTLAGLWPVTRQLFGPIDRARLLGVAAARRPGPSAYRELLAAAAAAFPDASPGALVSYAEMRAYMHDVLLRDADQMSMAHGLEVRVPLVDHRLTEYVLSLPDEVRLANGQPKALLVESLSVPLPRTLVDRPKRGFTLPFDTWMRQGLCGIVDRHLGNEGLEGRRVFEPGEVIRTWRAFLEGRPAVTWSRVWTLVALDAWMARLGIEAAP